MPDMEEEDSHGGGLPWRVSVDAGRCVGSGICAAIAPERFRVTDGTSRPRAGLIQPDEAALDAADSCPAEAIAVRAAGTGHLLGPRE